MSYNRCHEPGWRRIGRIDSTGRRSLWIRETWTGDGPACIELCAGREGDDAYVRLTPADPQWRNLENVFASARFAAEYEDADGHCMDSGTIPHPSGIRGELVRGRFTRAWCSCCEREVALRNGCLSHHGPNPERKTLLRGGRP